MRTLCTSSDDAIVDYAAARGVEVLRQHRDHLGRMQRIATMLAHQLEILLSGNKPDVPFLGLKESASRRASQDRPGHRPLDAARTAGLRA